MYKQNNRNNKTLPTIDARRNKSNIISRGSTVGRRVEMRTTLLSKIDIRESSEPVNTSQGTKHILPILNQNSQKGGFLTKGDIKQFEDLSSKEKKKLFKK